jgi:hypothetical protein
MSLRETTQSTISKESSLQGSLMRDFITLDFSSQYYLTISLQLAFYLRNNKDNYTGSLRAHECLIILAKLE